MGDLSRRQVVVMEIFLGLKHCTCVEADFLKLVQWRILLQRVLPVCGGAMSHFNTCCLTVNEESFFETGYVFQLKFLLILLLFYTSLPLYHSVICFQSCRMFHDELCVYI